MTLPIVKMPTGNVPHGTPIDPNDPIQLAIEELPSLIAPDLNELKRIAETDAWNQLPDELIEHVTNVGLISTDPRDELLDALGGDPTPRGMSDATYLRVTPETGQIL